MNEKLVDARGLSCPEPVLMTQQALAERENEAITVAVSSATARDNVSALLQDKGRSPKTEERDGEWFITAAAR